MNEKEIEQLVLYYINMNEDPHSKCVRSWVYEELARDIAESLVKKLTLTDVSVTLICDVEKGTKCKDPFPKYDTGVCRNCFGQSN